MTITRLNINVRVWDKNQSAFINLPATIDVDPEIIASDLAAKAFKNKSKQSKIAHGGVVLSIVSPKA